MASAQEQAREGMTRRQLLIAGNFGVAGVIGVMVAVPLVGYVLGALGLKQPIVRSRIGPVSAFPFNVPTLIRFDVPVHGSGITERRPIAAYVVRSGTELFVFYNGCTHMGCPVRWDSVVGMYLCPCHGGMYDKLGRVVHGPPPFSLHQLNYEVVNEVLYVFNNVYD